MLDSNLFSRKVFSNPDFKLWLVPITDNVFLDTKDLNMLQCKILKLHIPSKNGIYSKETLTNYAKDLFKTASADAIASRVTYLNRWFNEIKFGDFVFCTIGTKKLHLGVVVGHQQTINNNDELLCHVRPVLWFDSELSASQMRASDKLPLQNVSKKLLINMGDYATANILLNTLKQCSNWSLPVLRYIASKVQPTVLQELSETKSYNLTRFERANDPLNICAEHYKLCQGKLLFDYGKYYDLSGLEQPDQAGAVKASGSNLGNSETAAGQFPLDAAFSTIAQVMGQADGSTSGSTSGTTSVPDESGERKQVALNLHHSVQDDMTHIAILRRPEPAVQSEPLADKTAATAATATGATTADGATTAVVAATGAGATTSVGATTATGATATAGGAATGAGATATAVSAATAVAVPNVAKTNRLSPNKEFELQQLKLLIDQSLCRRIDRYNFAEIKQNSALRGHGSKISAFMHSMIVARFYNCFTGDKMTALLTELLQVQGFTPLPFESNKYGSYAVVSKPRGKAMQECFCLLFHPSLVPCDRETVDFCRSLLARYGASYVVLISWTGFTEQVQESIAMEFLQFRLWTGEDLVQCYLKHYHLLSAETQHQIPLKSVWILR